MIPAGLVITSVGIAVTVITIVLDVAVGVPKHGLAVDVITTVTASLLTNVAVANVGLFVPAFTPFTFHWYEGVPPFVGVAVKVTLDPGQIDVAVAAILTLGVSIGLTVTVTGLVAIVQPEAVSVAT